MKPTQEPLVWKKKKQVWKSGAGNEGYVNVYTDVTMKRKTDAKSMLK